MNYFRPSGTFEKAVEMNDKEAIKALLVGIIGADPTFATSEFQEAFNYVKSAKNTLDIEEEYQKQPDEYRINKPEEWDEKYFQMNLVWLRDNFNMNNRMNHIKEVGKKAYAKKSTIGKSKISQMQTRNIEEKKEGFVQTTVDEKENNRLNIKRDTFEWKRLCMGIGIGVAIVVVIALVGLAIYKFVNR